MKCAIYLEAYEIETVASALEAHVGVNEPPPSFTIATGRRELRRLAKKFRDTLAPKPVTP